MMKKLLSRWGSGEDGKGKKSSTRANEGLVRGPEGPTQGRNGPLVSSAGPGEYEGQDAEPPDAGSTRGVPSFITNAANLPSYGQTAAVPLPLPTAPVALPLPEPCSPPKSLPNSYGNPQGLPSEDSITSGRFKFSNQGITNQGLTRLVPEGDPATMAEKGVSNKTGLTISHSGANKSSFASPRQKGIGSVFKSTPRGKSSNQNPLPFNFPNQQRPTPLEVLTGAKRTAVKPGPDSTTSEPNASPQTLSDLATPSPNLTPRSAPDWTSAVPPISPFWNKHSPNAPNPLHQKLRRSPSLTSNPESVDNSTTSSPLSRFSPVGQHANIVLAAAKIGKSAPSSSAHSDAFGKPDGSASGVSIISAVSEPALETDSTELARTLSEASETARSVPSPRSSVGDESRDGGEPAAGRVLLGLPPWEETQQSDETTEESSLEGSESTESSAAGNWLSETSQKQGGDLAPSVPPPRVHFDLNPPSDGKGGSNLLSPGLASPRGKTAAVLLGNDSPGVPPPALGGADTFEPLREVRKKEVGEEDLTRSITPRTAEALRLRGGVPESSGVAGSKSPQKAVGGVGNRVQRPLNTHLNVPKQLTPIKAGPAWHESIAGLPVSSSEPSSSGLQAHPLPDIGRTLTPPSSANTPSPKDAASPLPPPVPHSSTSRGSSRGSHARIPSDANSNHLRTSSEGRLKLNDTISPGSSKLLQASGISDTAARSRPTRGQSDPIRADVAYFPRTDAHPLPSSEVARTLSDPLVPRGTKRASLDLDATPLPLPLPPSEDRSVKAGQVLPSPGQASPVPLHPHTAYPLNHNSNHSGFPVNRPGSHASNSPSAASTRSLSPHASPISVLPQGARNPREFRGGAGDQGPKMPVNWRKGDKLGSGTFGSVYRGMNSDNGEMFAVKEVGEAQASVWDESTSQLEHEVALLSRLKHPNIVQYVGTKREDSRLYIFLEYMPGGSIESLLRCYGRFEEPLIRVYTKQILCGLKYLHNQSTIHRDIKGANLLVDIYGTVKLADFGMAKQICEGASLAKSGIKGSPFWMAPEVVRHERRGDGRPADIWSVGCTVLEMAEGVPPWSRDCTNHIQIIYKIASSNDFPHIPDHLSQTAVDFIKLCLNRSPDDRPKVDDLLNHPFIADVAPETPPEMAAVVPRASPPGTPSPRPPAQIVPRSLLRTGQAPPVVARLSRQSSGTTGERLGEPSAIVSETVSATVAALVDTQSAGVSGSKGVEYPVVASVKQPGSGPKLRPKTPPPNWSPNGPVPEAMKPGVSGKRGRTGEVNARAMDVDVRGNSGNDLGGETRPASTLIRHKSADAPMRRPLGTLLEDNTVENGRLYKGLSVPVGVGKKENAVAYYGPAITSS